MYYRTKGGRLSSAHQSFLREKHPIVVDGPACDLCVCSEWPNTFFAHSGAKLAALSYVTSSPVAYSSVAMSYATRSAAATKSSAALTAISTVESSTSQLNSQKKPA